MKCEECVFWQYDSRCKHPTCECEDAEDYSMATPATHGCDLGQPKEPTK